MVDPVTWAGCSESGSQVFLLAHLQLSDVDVLLFLCLQTHCLSSLEKVMGIKGRRVHMIEELSDTVISFQRGDVLHGVIVCQLTHSPFPPPALELHSLQECCPSLHTSAADTFGLSCYALTKPLACHTAASQSSPGSKPLVSGAATWSSSDVC